jgi:hypothetical protein
MNIDEQVSIVVQDNVTPLPIQSAKEIIISNLVEVNGKSKENFLNLYKIGNDLLEEIILDFKKLDVKEKVRLWEKIQNIMLASKEIDVDLINPKNNAPSVVFQTEEKQKDNIDKFIDGVDPETMKKFDEFIKILQKN